MAQITFTGGATLTVPGSAQEVATALGKAARKGRYWSVGDPPTLVNPAQVAFVGDPTVMVIPGTSQ